MKPPHSLAEAYKRGHDVNNAIARALLQVKYAPTDVDGYDVTVTAVSENGDENLSLDILASVLRSHGRAVPGAAELADTAPLTARVSADVLEGLGEIAVIIEPAQLTRVA